MNLKNIDKKDRRLLAELDNNSRLSDSNIAKRIGVSKQVVNYRLKKLLETKIIDSFYPIINTTLLGFDSYYVFIQLENTTKEKEERILQELKQKKYIGWLVSCTGKWDLIIMMFSQSIHTFDKLLDETLQQCEGCIHEYTFTTMVDSQHISYKFLEQTKNTADLSGVTNKPTDILETDVKIIYALSKNARAPITEIAKLTSIESHTVRHHILKLQKQGIITGYKPKLNVSLLGYTHYLLLIRLTQPDTKRKNIFIEYCKQHKDVYYLTRTIGEYSLMLDLHLKTPIEIKEILTEIKSRFSNIIKNYETLTIFEEYKISYCPNITPIKEI